MQIKIPQNLSVSADSLIKRCGYGEIKSRKGISYVRRLRGYRYPRFHIYIENNYFNLHLDQKATVYNGMPAHSADYNGPVIDKETERIKEYIDRYLK